MGKSKKTEAKPAPEEKTDDGLEVHPELTLLPGQSEDDWDIMNMDLPDNDKDMRHGNIETHPPVDEAEAELMALVKAAEEAEKDASTDEADKDDEEDGESDTEEDEDVDDTDVADIDEDVESEEESDDEDDDDSDDESDEPQIPKHRFDEVNRKRKEAEAELARLRAKQEKDKPAEEEEPPTPAEPPKDEFNYDDAEDRYQDALLEGRKDDAKAIRKEMREAELQYQSQRARYEAEQVTGESSAMAELRQTAEMIEAAYPEFDSASDVYNSEMTQEALELANAYMSMKKYATNPKKALLDASNQLLQIYGVVDREGNRVDAESEVQSTKRDAAKKKSAVKKKVEAANAQPPRPKRKASGSKEPRVDLDNMSETEWASLPESTKARLRGDYRV